MEKYLIWDATSNDPRVGIERPGWPLAHLRPFSLTDDGQVIYHAGSAAEIQQLQTQFGNYVRHRNINSPLWYTDAVQKERRLVCETALAQLVLDNPACVQDAVNRVSRGVQTYWRRLSPNLGQAHLQTARDAVHDVTRRIAGNTSFGRQPNYTNQAVAQQIVQVQPITVNDIAKQKMAMWLRVLNQNPLDIAKIMNVHDAFLKIYCMNQIGWDPNQRRYLAMQNQLFTPISAAAIACHQGIRPAWYDDRVLRGRRAVRGGPATSMRLGIIPSTIRINVDATLRRSGINPITTHREVRRRGIDHNVMSRRHANNEFFDALNDPRLNLVFSASASGTTSTLLAVLRKFSPEAWVTIEMRKQYLLACVAYLVGGGMHTVHEVFYTGSLTGLRYTPGKYLETLPESFMEQPFFEQWKTEFWDIMRNDQA